MSRVDAYIRYCVEWCPSWWLTPYCVLELGFTYPVLEALAAYWESVRQRAHAYYHLPYPITEQCDPGLLMTIVRMRGHVLLQLHEEEIPQLYPQLCLAAVMSDSRLLAHIPERLQTPTICATAVCRDGNTIRHVYHHTPYLRVRAVSRNGMALAHIPEAERTPGLCRAAVQSAGAAIRLVPAALLAEWPDIAIAAVQGAGGTLQHVAESTPEVCRRAVRNSGVALQYVPAAIQLAHPDIVVMAVTQNGKALQYVVDKTPQVCRIAVKQNRWAKRWLPSTN